MSERTKFARGVRVRAWHANPLILGQAERHAREATMRSQTEEGSRGEAKGADAPARRLRDSK